MISIQTNVNSLVAQQNLSVNSSFQSKTIQQLTSGYRINQSGDDAAGLAVANKFRSTVAELTQGVANGNDATAQLQIMDGGMNNISLILDRLKTLATQSASGTFTGNRTVLNSEFQNALSEIDRQAQSIGLNTGGLFAKNLDVFLGAGSGSSSLQNGIVTLGLTQSAVDSQSLGMKGMQAVNLTSGTDIGATSATSVQSILSNVSGANPNQQAVAGYAAMQFSGAGFADAGKVSISVNLAGVTDVATLATAVNAAIQSAGNGTTAAATAFKNANIVASLHTDSSGGQQLAFSSGTAAFQVQAGDQMANALLGKVAIVVGVAQGTAIAGTGATNVTGAATTDGLLTQGQTVKLVVTGGGLAGPVTLQVNTSGNSQVSTSGAITDLETQFSGNALLAAAGLSMAGTSTPGSALSFASATGQGFNVQVSGDTANLLGLGSFLVDSGKNADYTAVTAGTAYSAATITGNATTRGIADGLQISLNGLAATPLTSIDLTAGANARAASLTSSATITGGFVSTPGQVDITALTNQANITVINNGVANNKTFTFGANQAEAKATVVSLVTPGMTQAGFLGYTQTAAGTSAGRADQFTIALDGGAAHTITFDGNYTAGTTQAALFLGDLQTAIDSGITGAPGQVVASWAVDPTTGLHTGELTLTSATAANGAQSTLTLGAATDATSGKAAASAISSDTGGTFSLTAAGHNNQFTVALNGGSAMTLTVADDAAYTATTLLAAIQSAIANTGGVGNSAGNQSSNVSANWALDDSGLNTGALTLTSAVTGASSSVSIGAATYATQGVAVGTLDSSWFATGGITVGANSDKFQISIDGGTTYTATITPGTYPTGGTSKADFLAAVQAGLDGSGIGAGHVTASWGALNGGGSGLLTLTDTSGTTGAGSYVTATALTYGTKAANVGTLDSTTGFGSPLVISALDNNNTFSVALDGGPSKLVTLRDGPYADSGALLIEVQYALDHSGLGSGAADQVHASWGAMGGGGTGLLTLTDNTSTTGLLSTMNVSAVSNATHGTATGTTTESAFVPFASSGGATNDTFMVSVDGGVAVRVTVDQSSDVAASIPGDINTAIGLTSLAGKVTASWDALTHLLTLASTSSGSASNVGVAQDGVNTGASAFFGTLTPTSVSGSDSAGNTGLSHVVGVASATQGAIATDQGLTKAGLTGATPISGTGGVENTGWSTLTLTKGINTIGNDTAANTGIGSVGLVAALTHGFDDAPTTVQSIALTMQTAFGTDALVTVSTDNLISIASTTKGANSSVLLNATANSVYGKLNLTSPTSVLGQNSSLADVVNNLNAQFSANGTAYQAAGLTAVATLADGTGSGNFITIQSNNGTQFRLNAVGAPAVATSGAVASSVTNASFSLTAPLTTAITVGAGTTDQFKVAVDGGQAQTLTVGPGVYQTTATFLAAVRAAIAASTDPTNGIAGKVTAAYDTATMRLTLTSVSSGTASSVTTSGVTGNTGLANLGFGTGSSNSGLLSSTTENTGFGVAGRTNTALPSSTGTSMSAFDAFGTSNSTVFTFSAMKFGNDKQAITFSATDANGVLETKTVTLQNDKSINRAGVSIDDAVAYINTQLQQGTSQPALQQIVAVKENVSGAEQINFVSSLSGFTVSVAATANADGLNGGVAAYRTSVANGDGANMQVDTKEAAKAAVTALATAVGKLGSAQAAVGKGQNQLYYAVNLAQSQITNFSAAESYIRDANVAQQAANLTKAQVLSQASIAAMAQANSAPQAVLALLRG